MFELVRVRDSVEQRDEGRNDKSVISPGCCWHWAPTALRRSIQRPDVEVREHYGRITAATCTTVSLRLWTIVICAWTLIATRLGLSGSLLATQTASNCRVDKHQIREHKPCTLSSYRFQSAFRHRRLSPKRTKSKWGRRCGAGRCLQAPSTTCRAWFFDR